MFTLHCKECHHEWESSEEVGTCDWCGAGSYILGEHHFNIYKILQVLLGINKEKKIKNFLNEQKKSLDSKK